METTHSKDFKAWNWEHAVFQKVKMIILGAQRISLRTRITAVGPGLAQCSLYHCVSVNQGTCCSEPPSSLFHFPLKKGDGRLKSRDSKDGSTQCIHLWFKYLESARCWTLKVPTLIIEFKAIGPPCVHDFLGLNFPICKMSRQIKQVFFHLCSEKL